MRANGIGTGSTRSKEAIAFTAALLVVTLVLLVSTLELRASSAMVPRAVGIPLALLLCYRLIREIGASGSKSIREISAQTPRRGIDADAPSGNPPDEVRAILWLFALPTASTLLGFVAGPALWVFAWARYRAGERVVVAIAAASITAMAIVILFTGLLQSPLWQGLLGAIA